MNTFLKITTAAATVALMSAGAASAKAHNQGNTETPGTNVGSETTATSQILGSVKGNGKGAQGNLGKSGDAGKPADDSDE